MLIYKATNKTNNKIYIGATKKSLNERKHAHYLKAKYNSKQYFHNAIRKYGEDNFLWEIIEDNINDQKILDEKEIHYIKFFDSIQNGYNISTGGGGGDNIKFNPNRAAICKKISEALKGKPSCRKGAIISQETRDKLRDANQGSYEDRYGKERANKLKNKISSGVKKSIQKLGHGFNKGHITTEEHKKNLSIALKGKSKPESFKKFMSEFQKNKILSNETKLKISQSKKGKPNLKLRKYNIELVEHIKKDLLLQPKDIKCGVYNKSLAIKHNCSEKFITKVKYNNHGY